MNRRAEMDMKAAHRLANTGDAPRLFEIRRQSILVLASEKMPAEETEAWAATLTVVAMAQKIHDLEVWVAELNDSVVGWGAIRADKLEGLYTDPKFAGRGIGTGLIGLLEALMRRRGIPIIRADASLNAEEFYFRRGYEPTGVRTPEGAHLIRKRL
jgi:putative acetyltransferase